MRGSFPQKLGDNMKVKAFGDRILGQMISPVIQESTLTSSRQRYGCSH